jgi:hypothetical protein
MKVIEPVIRLPYRRGSVEFCLGSEADHEAVYQTLLHVFHGPDRAGPRTSSALWYPFTVSARALS